MRHIKIYEEYSDEDLKDLMGDLETIGHKHKLEFGKDYGLGSNFQIEKRDVSGKSTLWFTPEAVEFLKETKYVKDSPSAFFDFTIKEDSLPKMKGMYGNKTISAGLKKHENKPGSPYYFKMFYKNQEFPELYYGKKFRTPTIIVALNKIISEIEALRK
jgi:hypothetical protein